MLVVASAVAGDTVCIDSGDHVCGEAASPYASILGVSSTNLGVVSYKTVYLSRSEPSQVWFGYSVWETTCGDDA